MHGRNAHISPILKVADLTRTPHTLIIMLTFDPINHIYQLNGAPLPSVTTVLKPLSGLDKVPPHILARAAEYGTNVHYMTELIDRDELDASSIPDLYRSAYEAYTAFLREHSPRFLMIEERGYNPQLLYAGTVDRVCVIDGKTYVLDIKTTRVLNPVVSAQLAAYAHFPAIEALKPDGILSLKLPKHDQRPYFELHEHDAKEGWSVFLSCLNLRNFCAKHKMEPTSYV